ncbi:hypothetical protein RUM44_004937 [Polyplax serrata]|uniref:Ig-like domain-containing protein n=1 Tax=Polyplax serrata TaxID=468196 RepID=A0ABR1AWI7_POLSC
MLGFDFFSSKTLVLLVIFSVQQVGETSTTSKVICDEEDVYDADVFCKSNNRLIKIEKSEGIVVVDTYEGNSVLLECKYCEEKDHGLPRTWSVQRRIFTGDITELEPSVDDSSCLASPFITKDHSLLIRNVQRSDVGLYFCKAPYETPPKNSFTYLIDCEYYLLKTECAAEDLPCRVTLLSVSTKPKEEIVGSVKDFKNYTQFYIGEVNKVLSCKTFAENTTNIKAFTEWSTWSECDFCFRKEGIRSRVGKCRVKFFLELNNDSTYHNFLNSVHLGNLIYNNDVTSDQKFKSDAIESKFVMENVKDLGLALSCRSHLLRKLNIEIYNLVYMIPDFVHRETCSGPIKGEPHKKGPRYKKSIILAAGAHLTLVCPDSTIDSDVHWEYNGVRLNPNEGTDYILNTEEPRLYVDSFNTLYLFQVSEKESGNYTCFVDGLQMQEVRIIVLTRSIFFTKEFTKHLKCLGFVFILCFFVYLLGILVTCIRSRSRNKMRKICKEAKKLLDERTNDDSDMSA